MTQDDFFTADVEETPPTPPEAEVVVEETLPAIVDLDTAPAAQQLAPYEKQIGLMVDRAKAVMVKDPDTNSQAVEFAVQAKKLNQGIEKIRKHYVEAPNRFVKAINNLAKRFQDQLAQIENGLKKKISDYQYQVEMERRKKEAEAKEEALKLQKRLDAEAKAAATATGQEVTAPVVATPIVPERQTVTRAESGSASQRAVWTFEVTDPEKVPRNYLMIDERAIRQAIAAGVREIAGVRIFEEFRTVIR